MTPQNRDSPNACCCCGGDSGNPLPLHQIHHRSAFLRLCTSCVLRHNPGSFCTACFDFLDPPLTLPLVYCASCPAVAHAACLPVAVSGNFLCPLCSSPHGFSYFPQDRSARRIVDLSSSKVLLTAAKISAASMNRAVAAAWLEAERKGKEAMVASKQARGLLECIPLMSGTETKMVKESASVANKSVRGEEPKSKIPRTGSPVASDVSAHNKFQDRQREKVMRFLEPTETGEGVAAVNSVHDGVTMDLKGQAATIAPTSNCVKQ